MKNTNFNVILVLLFWRPYRHPRLYGVVRRKFRFKSGNYTTPNMSGAGGVLRRTCTVHMYSVVRGVWSKCTAYHWRSFVSVYLYFCQSFADCML